MRKQGPCFHCGIENWEKLLGTPLWRNGPPEKPVLCNACGSRYRLGKPLENYTPKNFHVNRNKKRKSGSKAIVTEKNIVESNACISSSSSSSALEEDDASSESSTSHNQNCFSIKQEILDDNPVENWGSSWRIHSRKRSPVVYSSLTTIQKLQRDLHNVLRHEDRLNSIASEGAEDVLIYNVNINKLQIPSTEIGLGIVLLKFPGSSSCHQDQQEIGRSSNIPGKFASPLNQAQPANPPSLRFLGRKKKRCRILPQDYGEKD